MEGRGWDGGSVYGEMKGIWIRRQRYFGKRCIINREGGGGGRGVVR